MPKPPSTDLFDLIHSMTTAEKRYFSLEVNTKNSDKDVDYYLLFELIDKMQVYDEKKLIEELSENQKGDHLPFKKIHLHKLILENLNRYHRNSGPEEEVLQLLQNLKILYDRGLFWQSEKLIKRIEKLCKEFDLKEYQVILLKWKRIMTLHMQNSKISKKLNSKEESDRIQELVSTEREILSALDSNLDVWHQVINIADRLRIGTNLNESVADMRTNIQEQLKDKELTFISKIRLYHSEFMLSYLVNKSEESGKYVEDWEELWAENKEMRIPYFRNYLVSLNIILTNLVDRRRLDECEPLYNILIDFTQRKNKEVSFINKCKAYSFYYKNYLNGEIIKGNYQKAIDSFELSKTQLYFEHFELFKKSQVYLTMTAANYMLGNYKEVGRTMILSHAEEDVVQKGCLLEIRLLYYLSLFKLDKLSLLEQIIKSSDSLIMERLKSNAIEPKLINMLIKVSKGKKNLSEIVKLLDRRDNNYSRYFQEIFIEQLKRDVKAIQTQFYG